MLVKQGVDISFAEGLDTKTDPKRVSMGKFLLLQNSVFTKGGLLQKRYGYGALASLPDTTYSYLTTFNGNLTAIGTSIAAYNAGNASWVNKGAIQPVKEATLPLIRNNLNQTMCDAVTASNGLICTVYLETDGATTTAKYVIANATTGQNITAPAAIPVGSGTVTGGLRVFYLGTAFVIVFTNVITGTSHLQYVTISANSPGTIGTNTDIASVYVPAGTVAWDGYVVGSKLFVAWNNTSGGQSVKVTYLSTANIVATAQTFAGVTATTMSVTADTVNAANPVVYISAWDAGGSLGKTMAVDVNLNKLLVPQTMIAAGTVLNIASAAQNGVCTLFYEVSNAYSFDSTIPTNYIKAVSVTLATTTVGSTTTIIRSVGLASKAFIVGGTLYFLAAYQSSYQPTYFLINGSTSLSSAPVIVAKLAYENGGGYLTTGLPSVTVASNVASVPYLFKDLIQAVNKGTAVPSGTQVNGIYSQTGINLATFALGTTGLDTSEVGGDLHLSGGFLWMYDGYTAVEHNFFLWPDSIKVATEADPAPTGDVANTSFTISNLSSVAGIVVGMTITGTAIPANTVVVSIGSTTVTMSKAATGTHVTEVITFTGNQTSQAYYYQVTYEWSDNQGNQFRSAPSIPVTATTSAGNSSVVVSIPTLRLTMKTANAVKIVIYRWSAAQQNYYQATSISQPLLNSTTTDSVSFTDVSADATILGNNLIYTTGGVVEDVNAPASNIMALFDSRFWLVNAEDPNVLWFSKQVIEATPVEMSDLFTIYVPPTVSTASSTGPITALGAMDDKLIIFKENAIYYLNGTGPDNTGANNQYSPTTYITGTVGCANQQSIVLTPLGLMFQSDKGIWLLGRGLDTNYIGAPVEEFNGSLVNSATVIPATNQVRFTLASGTTLMYDYYYAQWGTFVGVPAVSSCIFDDMHSFINSSGSAYQETPGLYLDGGNPVLMSFKTAFLRLGDLQNYQRAYFFYFLGTYFSPHRLFINVSYDYEDFPSQSMVVTPINYSATFGDGEAQSPYGQGTPYGGPTNLYNWRVFLQRQRCMAFAIEINEVFDASFGTTAGAGFSLSGLNVVMGLKQRFRPQDAQTSVG